MTSLCPDGRSNGSGFKRKELRIFLKLMINLVDRRAEIIIGAVKEGMAASKADADKTQEMLGVVLEVAVLQKTYLRLGVKGGGAIMTSLDDVLQFVLPGRILFAAAKDHDFFRAVRAAIIASLLHKVLTVRQYSAWGLPTVAGATCATAVTLVVLKPSSSCSFCERDA